MFLKALDLPFWRFFGPLLHLIQMMGILPSLGAFTGFVTHLFPEQVWEP